MLKASCILKYETKTSAIHAIVYTVILQNYKSPSLPILKKNMSKYATTF